MSRAAEASERSIDRPHQGGGVVAVYASMPRNVDRVVSAVAFFPAVWVFRGRHMGGFVRWERGYFDPLTAAWTL